MPDFRRKRLGHDVPFWIDPTQEAFFITINSAPRGRNQLAKPEIWEVLCESVEFREQREEWKWCLFLAMPDHLHGIISFPAGFALRASVAAWKRWLARNHDIRWQDGFFDHRLRSPESASQKANYSLENPIRAGLAAERDDWPYVRDRRR
ncbi:transposase [Haloferula helveola]|uniref:Transposase n=1 Tax=Haloferula helveola TaxID=490095 RepID=A0ABM7RG49_9BACT|nr:transposase [Haloferula helveola]